MTTYVEVAQALVSAGYLTDADVEAAAAVLADALIVEDAEDAEADGILDEIDQEDVIEEEIDEEIIAEAETVIDAAYTDAAAALLAAELIDEANLDAVAAAIDGVWVIE